MTSLDLLASFASAARHASFAKAARELGLSPSAVAKNVTRLEGQLGVRLFHRTTRQVTMSQDGEALYERCRRVLEEMESLEATVAETRGGPGGTLRIDMPLTYGRQFVLPVLTRLAARYPALRIDARFSDHLVDIVKEGLDAAVRIGPLADSSLVARVFDRQWIWTCASPAYLRKHAAPRRPDELAAHRCLLFRLPSSGRDRVWRFREGKEEICVVPDSGFRLGEGEALVQAAMAGLGVIQVPHYMVEAEVRRGKLVEVLQKFRAPPFNISLVYPSQHHVPARVRVLVEALLQNRSQKKGSE